MSKRSGNTKSNYKEKFKTKSKSVNKPEFEKEGYTKSLPSANDPSWYLKDPAMASWANSLVFNKPAGTPFSTMNAPGIDASLPSVAGIMTAVVNPSIGKASTGSDAVNSLAVKYYTDVRRQISGSRTYEAPDLMIYTIAASSLYSAYQWACRLYGMAFKFSQQNRYVGDALLTASNVDPDDFRKHLADFRLFLNAFAAKISVFAVPANISYFRRQMMLYSSIYSDSSTAKSQLYMYVPAYFLKYDATGSQHGGQLIKENVPGSPISVAGIEQILTNLLNAMYYDSDIYTMSGDVSKAFNNLLMANPIAEGFAVNIVYDSPVLSQFENTNTVPLTYANDVVVKQDQNNGVLVCQPTCDIPLGGLNYDHVLNFHKEDITVPDIFEAITNITALGNPTHDRTGYHYPVASMGTESISQFFMYYLDNAGVVGSVDSNSQYLDMGATGYAQGIQTIAHLTGAVSNFDWHPFMAIYTYDSSTASYDLTLRGEIFDYDVYTVLKHSDVEKLHDIALWSLFTVE